MSETQGRYREAGSERRVEQIRDLTDRNWIRGWYDRTREHEVSKSISIKGHSGKFSRCTEKDIELTPGDLHFCPHTRTEGIVRFPERSGEVSRGHSTCYAGKARTVWSG